MSAAQIPAVGDLAAECLARVYRFRVAEPPVSAFGQPGGVHVAAALDFRGPSILRGLALKRSASARDRGGLSAEQNPAVGDLAAERLDRVYLFRVAEPAAFGQRQGGHVAAAQGFCDRRSMSRGLALTRLARSGDRRAA